MSDVPVKPLGSQVDLRHVYHVPDDTFPENRSLPDKRISLRTVLRLMAVTIATVTVVLGLTIGVVVWTALKVGRLDETGSPDTLSMVETENRSAVTTSACGTNESSGTFVLLLDYIVCVCVCVCVCVIKAGVLFCEAFHITPVGLTLQLLRLVSYFDIYL